jgi:tellurite resistance protein
MIIFGTRGVTSTKETGPFNCPTCGDQRAYSRKSVRRFFTLYFIPLIPLDQLGEYIECITCKQQFTEAVLAHDPIGQAQQLQAEVGASLKRILAIVMMADGKIDDAQIAAACHGYEQVLGMAIDSHEIQSELGSVQNGESELIAEASRLRDQLNETGKHAVMQAAIAVALADGPVEGAERTFLGNLARELAVPLTEVPTLIRSATVA